ncbi:hypothetical protein N8S42_24685, partial [Enterobacter hormaechei subsp. steigerwaltii]|nr:hypothetical protein [Enterobacter hormaechei subsp. steigerwaltii]MCU3439993.1 hypothetical protein [Enterobacter hormaechei subsp. steigerwaltii]MCU3474102.1 hypothetical protein [Enterobacter hormaechei subsp. steigerwaltii]MCU3905827.1 hypothetical protein [Enterobacter hormaechei subsp. steigerwaltii]
EETWLVNKEVGAIELAEALQGFTSKEVISHGDRFILIIDNLDLKWFTEFGHLNRGDMLTSEQHRCHNEKKKFQRRV